MNINQIEGFLLLISCESYGEAANKADVSIATLSRRISSLEQDLTCKLIIRGKNELKLTKAGNLFLEFATNFIVQLKSTKKIGMNMPYEAKTKICLWHSLAMSLLNNLFVENPKFINSSYEIFSSNADHAMEKLLLNMVDLVIGYYHYKQKD